MKNLMQVVSMKLCFNGQVYDVGKVTLKPFSSTQIKQHICPHCIELFIDLINMTM